MWVSFPFKWGTCRPSRMWDGKGPDDILLSILKSLGVLALQELLLIFKSSFHHAHCLEVCHHNMIVKNLESFQWSWRCPISLTPILTSLTPILSRKYYSWLPIFCHQIKEFVQLLRSWLSQRWKLWRWDYLHHSKNCRWLSAALSWTLGSTFFKISVKKINTILFIILFGEKMKISSFTC